jgi:O-antigen ligase
VPVLPASSSEAAALRNLAFGWVAAGAAMAVATPPLFWWLLAATAAGALLFVAWRHLPAVTALWLLAAGATLEMVLTDLIGPDAFQPAIAAVKGGGLLLAGLAMLRYGMRLDWCNPALAWGVVFLAGLGHGLWPDMSADESLRSLIGSAAPFAFGFSRLSHRWAHALIRTARWVPLPGVAAGAVLAAFGMHPLFIDSGGERLAGLSHPAFLAGVCQTAVYACLVEFYRCGRRSELGLLLVNLLLLVLTGARAPLGLTLAVLATSLGLAGSPVLPGRRRGLMLLCGAALLPVLAALVLGVFGADLSPLRTLNVLATDAGNLSGRQILWPSFVAAASGSPWFGWGVGAGNAIIPPDSEIARLLHTWAAHNEYLRLQVEGGRLGRALLIASLVLWVRGHTARLPVSERRIMRLVFLGEAVHAFTDNVLISTPACVLFAFATAVFARGRLEQPAGRDVRHDAGSQRRGPPVSWQQETAS